MTDPVAEIIAGVDTHKDTHTAAAIDPVGRELGSAQFPATTAGFMQLLAWLRSLGTLLMVGMEGTGSYGAGLARYLAAEQVTVVEVEHPTRTTRRGKGKSDPIDAVLAARAALTGHAGTPKQRDGKVEALRNLRIARSSAVAHRAQVLTQIKDIIVTAPEPVRAGLRALTTTSLVRACAAARPDSSRAQDPVQAVKIALRHLARRWLALSVEIAALDTPIETLVTQINPALLILPGVGPETAGQLLVTAGENRHRIRSDAAFAKLTGTAPIPASSGRTDRHRLNRGGDRKANAALHRIVVVRMRHHQPTRAYVERRTAQGLSKRDIIRCLKRYVSREIYHVLTRPDHPKSPHPHPA